MAPHPRRSARHSEALAALHWGTLAALLAAPAAGWANGFVVGDQSTNTSVQATTYGTGGAAVTVDVVTGGKPSGSNLYHRFTKFDTLPGAQNGQLQGVFFDIQQSSPQHLIIGIASPSQPTTLSVPIVLSQQANLIVMSPFGMTVTGGASFGYASAWGQQVTPLNKVALTTANSLSFTGGSPSMFEAVPQQDSGSGFPNGTPNLPDGFARAAAITTPGVIILDGRTQTLNQQDVAGTGPVTLQVGQQLMVAALGQGAVDSTQANLQPVQVKGQVTLRTFSGGNVIGSFKLGEWQYDQGNVNASTWAPSVLIADASASTMSWNAPVEVTPGSEFRLASGVGIDLWGLIRLKGIDWGQEITFASLISDSGDNFVKGGLELFGPGKVQVLADSLTLNGNPSFAVEAVYPQQNCTSTCYTFNPWGNTFGGPYGAQANAFNLQFDIGAGATATVNGAIALAGGGVTKTGAGTLTLNSLTNAYTGPTNVENGHLQVNGAYPTEQTTTCSGNGTSNRCAGMNDDTELLPQDLVLVDEAAVILVDGPDSEAAADQSFAAFDSGNGEGAITAPDLDVDVAVNDSFVVPDSDNGTESGSEPVADASTPDSETDTASADGATAESDADTGTDTDTGTDGGGEAAAAGTEAGGGTVTAINAEQASDGLVRADGQATKETLQSLAPELGSGGIPPTPTPQQLQQEMQRQVQRIQGEPGRASQASLGGARSDEASWIASTDLLAAGPLPPSFQRASYRPAVLHIRFSEERPKAQAATAKGAGKDKATDAFLDITLVPLQGAVEGRRVELSKAAFAEQLRQLYASLSRQDSLDVANPKAPARQLYNTLLGPVAPLLQAQGVTTLLIAADRGLQAVPFAALHDGSRYLGDRYAFAITPSLALTNLSTDAERGQTLLAAGASSFEGLAPLPLVPQELNNVGGTGSKDLFLNRDFTPEVLLEKAGDSRYGRVHVATHAEFLPGGPAASYLYSGVGPIPLSTFTRLRQQRQGAPLDLISFSACRTAIGDPSSELGFAGLAVQAGARSAAGTLWYVDDVATSAYFQQLYRHLGQGVPKAEALQLTRQAFQRGLIRLEGDRVLAPDGVVLLQNLTSVQQRRVRDGFQNPYFWAGVELVGAPW